MYIYIGTQHGGSRDGRYYIYIYICIYIFVYIYIDIDIHTHIYCTFPPHPSSFAVGVCHV